MSRGKGVRRASGEPASPRVWLVLHPDDSDYEKRLRKNVSAIASELGIDVVTRRTRYRRLTAVGGGSRPIKILEPADAHELYRDLSLRKCYVLSRGSVFVLHDPRRDPPEKRDCLPLAGFVQYKAAYCTLEDGADVGTELRKLLESTAPSDCRDHHDPRVLPLHVFEKGARDSRLDTDAERASFRVSYLHGRSFVSDTTGTWTAAAAGAWHGVAGAAGQVLRVWDYLVPQGFHWDTNAGRKRRTLFTAMSVWRVDQEGYVNVYPDSHVRTGARAKEVWRAQRRPSKK